MSNQSNRRPAKKSNKKLILAITAIAVVVIAVCVVVVMCLPSNSGDNLKDTSTIAVSTKATEATTQKPEETKAESKTESEAESKVESDDSDQSSSQDTEKTESNDEVVVPNVEGLWGNENNLDGFTIYVSNQNGNTMDIEITAIRGNENGDISQMATVKKTITVVPDSSDSVLRGKASFDYVDSFNNEGTCSISVSENVITLIVEEKVNNGTFGISNASGDYILTRE